MCNPHVSGEKNMGRKFIRGDQIFDEDDPLFEFHERMAARRRDQEADDDVFWGRVAAVLFFGGIGIVFLVLWLNGR